jgi:uncharacterized protein (TIGR00252 family)
MKTTEQGLAAEQAVADLMSQQGFELIDKNYKTKVCEIDLIMQQNKIVYFIEVKYRSNLSQGDGFEYVTDQKLMKMTFGAKVWCRQFMWEGDYRLMAAAVTGSSNEDIQIVELG